MTQMSQKDCGFTDMFSLYLDGMEIDSEKQSLLEKHLQEDPLCPWCIAVLEKSPAPAPPRGAALTQVGV